MGCACATRSAAAARPERIEVLVDRDLVTEGNPVSPKVSPLKFSSRRSFHSLHSIEGKLGAGCFARVYSCKTNDAREEDEADVAAKITDYQGSTSKLDVAQREAAILESIGSHENVCRYIDSMYCRRFHYIVMERYDLTLMNALDALEQVTEWTIAGFVKQMLQGVQAVHDVGVVHRDVKPDNFMCTKEGVVKLCDFGLAGKLPSGPIEGDGIIELSGCYGTAPFMSPEMVQGDTYGRSTDVWSLGVSLYALVTGKFPYKGERNFRRLMRQAIAIGVPAPSFECCDPDIQLSDQVRSLMQELLDRNPETRPVAADALQHSWFNQGEADDDQPCLRAVLQAAKEAGAFGVGSRGASKTSQGLDRMERALLDLQDRYRSPVQLAAAGDDSCSPPRSPMGRKTSRESTAATTCPFASRRSTSRTSEDDAQLPSSSTAESTSAVIAI